MSGESFCGNRINILTKGIALILLKKTDKDKKYIGIK